MQTDSQRHFIHPMEHAHRAQSGKPGERGLQHVVAGLLRICRLVTCTNRKATRNALSDSWPVVSLTRRDGLNSLPSLGLRHIGLPKCWPDRPSEGRAPLSHHIPKGLTLTAFRIRQCAAGASRRVAPWRKKCP